MANIWNATLQPNNNIKQNTFDWTHINNLTTQIGRITPIQCELVPSKTSFRVKPIPALQLMPMVFPVQTRMRASIAYFRYPLRALWKDYKDFVGNFREGLEEPFHDFRNQSMIDKMLGTGKLMDYLGVPTTIVGDYGNVLYQTAYPTMNGNSTIPFRLVGAIGVPNNLQALSTVVSGKVFDTLYTAGDVYGYSWIAQPIPLSHVLSEKSQVLKFDTYTLGKVSVNVVKTNFYYSLFDSKGVEKGTFSMANSVIDGDKVTVTIPVKISDVSYVMVYGYNGSSANELINSGQNLEMGISSLVYPYTDPQVATGITVATSPYYNSTSANKDNQIKLSAYAARAYEGIYNSFYRDNRNNPYYINDVVQYNQWIPSYDGGADTYSYELRYANWEKDFLTTAVQSPQQGNAPLVGITTYDQISTVSDENGNPTQVKQTKVAMVDEGGKRYSLEFVSDDDELKDVKYVELDNGTTVRSARSLFDLVSSGISITDLRNVNAYQKFLELNMRKGYSYKEIIEGRFDVKVRYADLLLPEFFGGFSRDINMNAISQTVDQTPDGEGSYKDVLGSQAGVGYFRGGSDANIECFCDEESIIMGLLVITPLPVYTQLLPKHFLYRGLLDHFNPEFNNISFQPITYKEVCPIQAYNADPSSLTETFGYQRPWYEYCQRYDQAHGLFRTDLSNFLMHRVFDQKPELAQSFLLVDPDQVTDVFSVTDVTDKVYGQILLDCTVKLPVARVAIPRLD
nr:MAG TPA: Major capsid protein [Microviridae sp.]